MTGLNGIRKTTSVYEPWFKSVLREALSEQLCEADCDDASLPSGPDSFYRQLDFMVASLAVEEFKALYGANLDVLEYSARKVSIRVLTTNKRCLQCYSLCYTYGYI